jgi:hypothetical protein
MIMLQREALRKFSVMHMHMQDLLKLCALEMIEYRQMAGRLQATGYSTFFVPMSRISPSYNGVFLLESRQQHYE